MSEECGRCFEHLGIVSISRESVNLHNLLEIRKAGKAIPNPPWSSILCLLAPWWKNRLMFLELLDAEDLEDCPSIFFEFR